ncbi:hypothetical protein F4678DRAFT_467742 [Xylaria arbuscula]|nr:hypothetical protein F4678DRAFT_467742 [Xylaria arbuscula]
MPPASLLKSPVLAGSEVTAQSKTEKPSEEEITSPQKFQSSEQSASLPEDPDLALPEDTEEIYLDTWTSDEEVLQDFPFEDSPSASTEVDIHQGGLASKATRTLWNSFNERTSQYEEKKDATPKKVAKEDVPKGKSAIEYPAESSSSLSAAIAEYWRQECLREAARKRLRPNDLFESTDSEGNIYIWIPREDYALWSQARGVQRGLWFPEDHYTRERLQYRRFRYNSHFTDASDTFKVTQVETDDYGKDEYDGRILVQLGWPF